MDMLPTPQRHFRTPSDINFDLAQRISSSRDRDSARAIPRRVRLTARTNPDMSGTDTSTTTTAGPAL